MRMNLTQSMRRDWDERARKNAFHYIASWRREWDLESFLASGEEDFQKLVVPVLGRCGIAAAGRAMIELGCGAGRMTGSFARRFERVYAFDLSSEMLGQARRIHANRANILWLLGNGADLGCVQTGSVDFVFSYLVLQHLPSEALALEYVREMLRVLRPGGSFLFQFNGSFEPTMNWHGRLAWGMVDALWSVGLIRLSRTAASLCGLDPAAAGTSWRGAAIRAEHMAEAVAAADGVVREVSGENTPMTWCCGVKHRLGE
jgi:SAM-dependent methyltransferase